MTNPEPTDQVRNAAREAVLNFRRNGGESDKYMYAYGYLDAALRGATDRTEFLMAVSDGLAQGLEWAVKTD